MVCRKRELPAKETKLGVCQDLGYGVEMMEQLENSILRHVFRIGEGSRVFEGWQDVAGVRRNGGVVVV